MVNVNSKGQALPAKYWDVGPFQLNQPTIRAALENGVIKIQARIILKMDRFLVEPLKKNSNFRRSIGKRTNCRTMAAAGGNDRQRAIHYAQRAGRGKSYDRYAPLFDRFFNCYHR